MFIKPEIGGPEVPSRFFNIILVLVFEGSSKGVSWSF
jgi:hypothetical protein